VQILHNGALALQLKGVIAARAKARQGTRTDIVPNLAQCSPGKTRDALAAVAGVSHGTIDKVEVVERDAPEPVKVAARAKENMSRGGQGFPTSGNLAAASTRPGAAPQTRPA
jgi:hypothetical protein